jgi:hypothetical protein
MKLPFLIGGTIGYVLGARAGRERYETIVRIGRRVAGSQTVQSTAGVLQAKIDALTAQGRALVSARLGSGEEPVAQSSTNGYHG